MGEMIIHKGKGRHHKKFIPSLLPEETEERKPVRSVPAKWPCGYCYRCCKPIARDRKLCDKHRDWVYGD